MQDRCELQGLTALVTGSSTGIGRAILLELAKAGAACIAHARVSRQEAEDVVAEAKAIGSEVTALFGDVSHPPDQEQLVADAWAWRAGVDIWINNAGADTLTGEAARWSFAEKLERLWQVDVLGTIGLSRLVGQRMKARARGVILNIGWDQAEQGMAGDSGELFATIKGAVMAFSRSLAKSLAPDVRVNCISPGWIKTAWGEQASDVWQERAASESLRGRWGRPEDIAAAARFLASPAADFVNGQVIAVNGGFRARNG